MADHASPYYVGLDTVRPSKSSPPVEDGNVQASDELALDQYRDEAPLDQEIEAQEQQNQADYARDVQEEQNVTAQMAECFKDSDREEFFHFTTRPGHVNAMRIDQAKQQRILHYLQRPHAPALRGQQAKDKFEAKTKWLLLHNAPHLIYRKPCDKFPQPRLLVPEPDAFDAIAYEHIRLGHYGRNRLQKLVCDRYYGISRQEIQWVIDRCNVCAPKKHRKPSTFDSSSSVEQPTLVEQASLAETVSETNEVEHQEQQQQQQHQDAIEQAVRDMRAQTAQ